MPRSMALARWLVDQMAQEEGLFCGLSSAAACQVALQLSVRVENITIVLIAGDKGDRSFPRVFFLPEAGN